MRKQDAPFTIKMELTEGCNYGCEFCGIRGIRKDGKAPFKYMTMETAKRIVSEIKNSGWKSRIMLSMHGEPTLNPKFLEIVKLIREELPKTKIELFTNGTGIKGIHGDGLTIDTLTELGLASVLIDIYSKDDAGDKLYKACKKEGMASNILGKTTSFYTHKNSGTRIAFSLPIQKDVGKSKVRQLCNHCGAAAPLDKRYNDKRCARPFRELCFRWDGNVSICCNDYRGEYPIASIHDMNIVDLWNHKRFQAARIMLYGHNRSFRPCDGCNAVSMRVGLLPDKMGKETLPEPTDSVMRYARKVSKENEPLCGDNWYKRPWEDK